MNERTVFVLKTCLELSGEKHLFCPSVGILMSFALCPQGGSSSMLDAFYGKGM